LRRPIETTCVSGEVVGWIAKQVLNDRGAWQTHKRLCHYFNVNRTSLDHLLLGKSADIDKCVECPDYSSAPSLLRTGFSLTIGVNQDLMPFVRLIGRRGMSKSTRKRKAVLFASDPF